MADWSHVPASYRFVGGRRKRNRLAREAAEARRARLVDLVCQDADVTQRALAVALHAHEATISRDLARLSPHVFWRFYIPVAHMLGRGAIKAAVGARWRAEPAVKAAAPEPRPAPVATQPRPAPVVHVEAPAPVEPAAQPMLASVTPAPIAIAPRPMPAAIAAAAAVSGYEKARRAHEAALLADALNNF